MGHLGVLRGPEGLEGLKWDPFEDPYLEGLEPWEQGG